VGLAIVLHMVPPEAMADCCARATVEPVAFGRWVAAAVIVADWLLICLLATR
jgi:hypothetical protein